MSRLKTIGIAAALAVAPVSLLHGAPTTRTPEATTPRFDGTVSVLTYNVHGLPWPVATGRGAALDRIGADLASMRARGTAPSVVVLQEAFTGQARAIGTRAGYRYIVRGPDDAASPAQPAGPVTSIGRYWWLGETEGKLVGSGLQVMSDYPIVRVRGMAFPALACAGYDCLANKGAMLVTVAIPGAPTPVDIIDTHLNSRHASHTEDARSLQAYREQVAALAAFVRANHDPRLPLIVAGDFNVGAVPPRREALMAAASGWSGETGVRDAYDTLAEQDGHFTDDMAYSRQRARDWQFFTDGRDGSLRLAGIDVPFGGYRTGQMLSDHIGYVASFRLLPPSPAASPVLAERDRESARPDRRELVALGD